MFDVTRWWYKRGVAGFRLDAVDTLFEDPEPERQSDTAGQEQIRRSEHGTGNNNKLPEVHTTLQELRKVADEYNAVLIGETWTKNIDELKQYYGSGSANCRCRWTSCSPRSKPLSAPEFRKQVAAVDAAGGWPVFVISNHDIVRAASRWGDGKHNTEIDKMMAALLSNAARHADHVLRRRTRNGESDPKRVEDVKDPIGVTGWPKEKGRDGERTPMQWSGEKNAGFTTGNNTWLPVTASL